MKSIRLLLFIHLFLGLQFADSQNWNPVMMNKTYHYSCDTTNLVFSIWADSIKITGTDTVVYTNRVILPCDTCNIQNYPNLNATRFLLKNQSLFLRRVIKYSTNSMIILENLDTLVIDRNSQVYNTWTFDTTANIQASVYFKGVGQVLGITDSIMGFLLNSNDTIIISKNHGVVQWPCATGSYFRLTGLEGDDTIGYHIPGYYEIYDFPVGSVFHLSEWQSWPDYIHDVNRTIRIEQVLLNTDGTFSYRINGCRSYSHAEYPNNYYYGNDTLDTIYSPDFFESSPVSYHNYPVTTLRTFQDTLYSNGFYGIPNCYYLIEIYLQNGFTCFEQVPTQFFQLNQNSDFSSVSPDILTNEYNFEASTHHILIIEKSGLVENVLQSFEQYTFVGTTDLNLNGDSAGLQCECCILSIQKNEVSQLLIFPNPTNNIINVSGISNGSAEIYTMMGQRVYQSNLKYKNTEGDLILDTEGKVAPGMYILKITSENRTNSFKLMITQ